MNGKAERAGKEESGRWEIDLFFSRLTTDYCILYSQC
jgi:hypothetical protein